MRLQGDFEHAMAHKYYVTFLYMLFHIILNDGILTILFTLTIHVYIHFVFAGLVELDPGVVVLPGPSVLVVQKNSPLMLNCSAYSNSGQEYTPISYSWMKDGKKLIPSKQVQIVENGSLYFQHIKKKKKRMKYTDEGKYICLLTNREGTVIGRQAQIKVASKYCIVYLLYSIMYIYHLMLMPHPHISHPPVVL